MHRNHLASSYGALRDVLYAMNRGFCRSYAAGPVPNTHGNDGRFVLEPCLDCLGRKVFEREPDRLRSFRYADAQGDNSEQQIRLGVSEVSAQAVQGPDRRPRPVPPCLGESEKLVA